MDIVASNRKNIISVSLILVISVLIEIFVCNANSFRVIDNEKFERKNYTLEQMEITNADVDTENGTICYKSEYGGSVFIHINNIDTSIGTVYMDLALPDNVLEYVVCYTDETNAEFYRSFMREYVTGVERTKWFTCHFNGQSKEMIIRLDNLEDGYTFALNEIQINAPVPFHFSMIRYMTISMIAAMLYLIGQTEFFMSTQKNGKHNLVLAAVFLMFLVISIVIYQNSYGDIKLNLMYNCDFTDALINGRLDLDIEVSDSLRALENPYDTSVRQSQGVDCSWDTAYYKGKYYCYYGVVPVLLFFVPYKLITGTYLQCNIVVMIAYCLYMLFLDIVFIKLIRHVLADVQFGMEMISMILLNAAINLFYFAAEPSFYLVPYAVGLMFTAMGFCCFIYWYLGKRRKRLLLFLGALCLSLAVGCRPPLLMYTLFIVPFGVRVIQEKKKESVVDMIVLMIPYLVIGSMLAIYNYLRFNSILEFGQTYQLTAQDQAHNSHTIYEIPALLWLGFFQPLNFRAVFPYIVAPDSANNYAGSFFVGPGLTSILGQIPQIWVLFIPSAWKKWRKSQDSFSGILLPSCAAVSFVLFVMELLNAGVEWRYAAEIAPVLCISAMLLIANMIRKVDRDHASAIMTLLLMTAVYTFAVSFLRAIGGPFGYTLTYHSDFYYTIERAFSFWK